MLALIRRETANAKKNVPARIVAKMNSLVDAEIILALYEASQAGVQIDLIVRGICCLRPGVRNLSENITVRSIVDRFLEHSRVFYFENGCQPEVYVGSADWMPRNFFRRIEVVFPVEDGALRDRLINEILAISLADNCRASALQPNGAYKPAAQKRAVPLRRSQAMFIDLVLEKSSPARRRKKQKGYPEVKLSRKPA